MGPCTHIPQSLGHAPTSGTNGAQRPDGERRYPIPPFKRWRLFVKHAAGKQHNGLGPHTPQPPHQRGACRRWTGTASTQTNRSTTRCAHLHVEYATKHTAWALDPPEPIGAVVWALSDRLCPGCVWVWSCLSFHLSEGQPGPRGGGGTTQCVKSGVQALGIARVRYVVCGRGMRAPQRFDLTVRGGAPIQSPWAVNGTALRKLQPCTDEWT